MKNNKAFTLIELLVVIAIIGLLSTLAVVALNNARLKARDVKRKADIVQLSKALELYYAIYNAYPSEAACDSSRGSCSSCPCSGTDWQYTTASYIGLSLRNAGLMQNLPIDPKNNTTYYYNYEPNCNQGVCTGKGCCDYLLRARLEAGGNFDRRSEQGH